MSAVRRRLIVKFDFGFSTLRGTHFDGSELRAQMSYANSENRFVYFNSWPSISCLFFFIQWIYQKRIIAEKIFLVFVAECITTYSKYMQYDRASRHLRLKTFFENSMLNDDSRNLVTVCHFSLQLPNKPLHRLQIPTDQIAHHWKWGFQEQRWKCWRWCVPSLLSPSCFLWSGHDRSHKWLARRREIRYITNAMELEWI